MTNFSLAFMHEIIVISNRITFNWNRKWNFFVCIFVFPIRIHWLLALMGEFKFLLHFETDKTYLWKFNASANWKKKRSDNLIFSRMLKKCVNVSWSDYASVIQFEYDIIYKWFLILSHFNKMCLIFCILSFRHRNVIYRHSRPYRMQSKVLHRNSIGLRRLYLLVSGLWIKSHRKKKNPRFFAGFCW